MHFDLNCVTRLHPDVSVGCSLVIPNSHVSSTRVLHVRPTLRLRVGNVPWLSHAIMAAREWPGFRLDAYMDNL